MHGPASSAPLPAGVNFLPQGVKFLPGPTAPAPAATAPSPNLTKLATHIATNETYSPAFVKSLQDAAKADPTFQARLNAEVHRVSQNIRAQRDTSTAGLIGSAIDKTINPAQWAQTAVHGVNELQHGHLAAGALDVAAILPVSRGPRAILEGLKAARAADEGARVAKGVEAARASYGARQGLLGGAASAVGKRTARTPEEAQAHLLEAAQRARVAIGEHTPPRLFPKMGAPVEPYVSKGAEYIDGPVDIATGHRQGFVFHRTSAESLPSIAKNGLKPSEPVGATGIKDIHGVYFSGDPLTAQRFAGKSKGPGSVFLRAKEGSVPDLALHPNKVYGEMITPHAVPAHSLEYLGADGQWHALSHGAEYDAAGGELGRQVRESLIHAPGVRDLQKPLHSEERGHRAQIGEAAARQAGGGTAGLHAALTELEGRFGRSSFPHLQHLTAAQLDTLHHIVDDSPLQFYNRLAVNKALENAVKDGVAPTEGEQALIERVFGKVAPETPPVAPPVKMGERIASALNIPRALRSSADLSMAFRQNIVVAVTHPGVFAKSFVKSARMFADPAYHQAIMNEIHNDPVFPLLQKWSDGKLFSEFGDTSVVKHEEAFVGGNAAEKLNLRELPGPLKGKKWAIGPGDIVKMSDRAFTGGLNYSRFMVGKQLAEKAALMGHDLNDEKLGKSIANLVGTITGRGVVPKVLANHLVTLNALLFSPRLIASRLNLLSPVYYAKLDPFARVEALRAARNMVATMGTVMMAAKMAGAQVTFDPRSSNFGKIKIGNTRIDITGGFNQYVRMIAQEMTREVITSQGTHQHITTPFVEKAGAPGTVTDLSNLTKYGRSKLGPIPGTLWDVGSGKNFIGQQVTPLGELGQNTPFLAQDIYDANKTGATPSRIAAAAFLSAIGFGVQSYKDRPASGGGGSAGGFGSGGGGGFGGDTGGFGSGSSGGFGG